jgi:hypothetical protein
VHTIAMPLSAAAVALAFAAPASAQLSSDTMTDRWAKSQGSRIGLEADVLSTSEGASISSDGARVSVLETSFAVVTQLGPLGGFHLDVELPFAYVSTEAPGAERGAPLPVDGFVLGNLTAGVHYAENFATSLAIFGGVTVSLPTTDPSAVASRYAAEYSSAARGFFDTHRMIVGHVPFRARAGAEARLARVIFLRGDAAAMLAVATGTETSDILIEQSDELEVRAENGLGGGLRFQAALPLSADDIVQAAIEPFVGYEAPEAGVYARLGFLLALDEPLGFGFDTGKVATFRFALGGKF